MDNKKFLSDDLLHSIHKNKLGKYIASIIDNYSVNYNKEYDFVFNNYSIYYNEEYDFAFLYLLPEYEEYIKIYQNDKYYHEVLQSFVGSQEYTKRFNHDYEIAKVRIDTYNQYFDFNSLNSNLDIGCANGAFVKYCSEILNISDGLDANQFILDFSQNKLNKSQLWHFSIEKDDTNIINKKYQCFTLHDVFEHLYYPNKALNNIFKMAENNFFLIIDIPDLRQGLESDIQSWKHFKGLQHPFSYTANSLDFIVYNSINMNNFDIKRVIGYIPIPHKYVKIYEIKKT